MPHATEYDAQKSPATTQLQQFYVAAGTMNAKLDSLIDFIQAVSMYCNVGIAVCCRTRNVMDELLVALAELPDVQLHALHVDLTPTDIQQVIKNYKSNLPALRDNESPSKTTASAPGSQQAQPDTQQHATTSGRTDGQTVDPTDGPACMQVVVTTDAALKNLQKVDGPIGASLLLHYELPTKKDILLRRQNALLGGAKAGVKQRLAVSFLITQELPLLQQAQSFVGATFEEMPVHVAELFQAV